MIYYIYNIIEYILHVDGLKQFETTSQMSGCEMMIGWWLLLHRHIYYIHIMKQLVPKK
jgi:hypothetical protein